MDQTHDTTLKPAPRALKFQKALRNLFGRDWAVGFPFVLPMVALMLGLIAWPFIDAIMLSLTTFNFITGENVFVGMRNYLRLFTNSDYQLAMGNTINFTMWSLSLKLITGMVIALVLNSKLPYRNVLSGIILLPWIVPEIVTALAWKSIFDPIFGGLNPILQGAGIIDRPLGWLSDPNLAMPSIIAVNVWKGIPFYVVLLLAGLKAIDKEQLEAATVDGADAVQRFRHVTLPGLRYVILIMLLLSFILTFNQFGLPFLMTGGGPAGATKLYSLLAYEKAIGGLQYGPGIAIALSVAPLMAVLIWLLAKFMRRDERKSSANRKPGIGDGIFKWFESALNFALDILFLPLQWGLRFFAMIGRGIQGVLGKGRELGRRQISRIGLWGRVALLVPFMIFVLFPFYWVVITSLKTTPQISERASIFWPQPFTLDQYSSLLWSTPFLQWLGNSVLVATIATVISVAFSALSAYALSRLKFAGANILTTLLLITYLLPGTLLFIPLYQILTELGVINSYAALIVTYPTFLLPFATWVLLGYFRSIPVELEEAAMIDGASRLYAFWKITLPLAMPGVLSVTLISFTTAWNEFLFAFVFITSESIRTLPIGMLSMVVGDILPWGKLMAASLLTAIPVAVLYIYAQRFLVEGLTVGGVKG